MMCRSNLHLHKQTPRSCLIRCGLRPFMAFVVVCAVVKNLLRLSTKQFGALSAKFLDIIHGTLF